MHLRSAPIVCIGILAMLAQLLLPSVHAAAYAGRSGDPLAYAVCGLGTSGLLAQMRDSLPREVIEDLRARHAVPALPDCQLCSGVHATAAPAPTGAIALILTAPAAQILPAAPARISARAQTLHPPSRAPPTPA